MTQNQTENKARLLALLNQDPATICSLPSVGISYNLYEAPWTKSNLRWLTNYLDHNVVSEQSDCCRQDGPEVDRPEGRQVLDRAEAEPGLEVAAAADQLQDQG